MLVRMQANHGSRSSREEGHITMEASMQSGKLRLTRDPKLRSFNHFHSYYSYPYHLILIVVVLLCCHSCYYLTVTVDALRKTEIVRSWGNGSS